MGSFFVFRKGVNNMRKILSIVLVLATLFVAFGQGNFARAVETTAEADMSPRVAIISAFGAELDAFKSNAQIESTVVVNGRNVYVGKFGGHEVIMTLSGGSMVNAAMSTQAILDRFKITKIVFSGIAGGVNPSLNVGDVVVPSKWAEYQENLFARETSPGVFTPPSWFTPIFPNFGMMFPQKVYITSVLGQVDKEVATTWFKADHNMVAIARSVASKVKLDKCTPDNTCLTVSPKVKVGGNGVAGPTFVDNAAYREYVWNTWQADALDMESAALAHVATVNAVPFVVFRSLSDLAGGGPGENEIGIFFGLAAGNSAKVMTAFMNALPK